MAFADLYRREGLVKLDQAFLQFLGEGEAGLRIRLDHARAHPDSLDRKDGSSAADRDRPMDGRLHCQVIWHRRRSQLPWPLAIISLLRFIPAKDSSFSAGR